MLDIFWLATFVIYCCFCVNMLEQDQWCWTNLHYGLTKFRLLSKSYFHPLYSIICLIVPVYSSMPALDWNHSHTPWQDCSCLPWLHCCWHKPQVSPCPENSHVTTCWASLISMVYSAKAATCRLVTATLHSWEPISVLYQSAQYELVSRIMGTPADFHTYY